MTTITYTYTLTQQIWNNFTKALLAFWIGMIAVTESAGRARAAAELTRMGYHAEAKRIMTEK
tara:strand:- start:184 stop:369 length:186 start_codon:yes stop_codon:yes gene_type:complete